MHREDFRRVLVTGDRGGPVAAAIDTLVAASVRHGITAFLVREHSRPAADQVAIAAELRARTRALILVSRHTQTARASRADGIVLGWDSPKPDAARAELGEDAIIGCSVHGVDEGLDAEDAGADFLLLGPVASTPKAHGPVRPLGWGVARELAGEARVPVVLIGGITIADEASVVATGAAGFAAIRGFVDQPAGRW